MKVINDKKLGKLEYRPLRDQGDLFDELGKEDFLLEGNHDKQSRRAGERYLLQKLSIIKKRHEVYTFKLSKGIVDEATAKRFLGAKLTKSFIIIEDSPRCPKSSEGLWQDFYVDVCLSVSDAPAGFKFCAVPIRVSSVLDILNYDTRVALMSFICHHCNQYDFGERFKIPGKYARYNVLAGADLADATMEEVEAMRSDRDASTTGWLYGRRTHRLEYAPEKVAGATFFFDCDKTLSTDCLVHAVNYALRFPFFVAREQVVRLMALRLKRSLEVAGSKKSEGGVPPSAFIDFCVLDGRSLSLVLVKSFKVEDG